MTTIRSLLTPKKSHVRDTSHLLVRRDGVLCTVCGSTEPVHPGNGNPMPAMLFAYAGVAKRHPRGKHADPFRAARWLKAVRR